MPDQPLPLSDIRVLDISEGVAGPFCAKLLAGLGAEVIKIEVPGTGDRARRTGPFVAETPDAEQSALFLYLNTGKKGITLDIRQPEGAAIYQRLAQDCDILIESAPPGDMDRLELGYAALVRLNAQLIYTAITPFGQTGPYRDYQGSELVAQATGGMMHVIGRPDREPLKIGGHAAAYTTGMSAFSATMLALHVRDEQGYGQFVDVSAMETMAVAQIHASIQHQFGHVPKRRDNTLVRARDGWVHPGLDRGIAEDTWARVCDLMGQPELADDPRFNTREARRENQAELTALIGAWTAARPKEEIYHTLQGLRTVAGYVATVEDLRTSRQLRARDFFQVIDHPSTGAGVYPGALFTLQDTAWQHGRAPLLGEHNREIYGERLGYSPEALAQLHHTGII
jgi:crotonobetainyl-CoA:carnitine CoA-transferase CaiB-like acyl-CoA transferase